MKRNKVLACTEEFVRNYMDDKEAGHNWWHIYRVLNNARKIYSTEKSGDLFIIEMASLLHDIGDDKIDPDTDGSKLVRDFLSDLSLDSGIIDQILEIMAKISFRDNLNQDFSRTAELDIVQDADRLDAIGAIGIARAFAYGGSKGNEIFNPEIGSRSYGSKEEYTSSDSSTINHFSEKLLKLKDLMNTDSGKLLARDRHTYMEQFLKQFHSEWQADS